MGWLTSSSFSGSEAASRLGLKLVRKSIESGQGRVSAVYAVKVGTSPMDCLFFAHPAKSSMNSRLVNYFHSGLAALGFLTVKFNFPYSEGRWRLVRKPDRTEILVECYKRVIEETRKSEWKPRNLFLGGVSMGAAVASHVVADGAEISGLKGLIFLSYPLHRPWSPDILGDKHLSKISCPMIFVAGTKDMYTQPAAVKSAVSTTGSKN